jgi:serine/threonine-protein kinase
VAASAAIPSVRQVIPVPGTPGYIELTPNGRQAWIAHRDTGVVSVLDVTSDKVVGQLRIPAGPPQFVAFCPDGRHAYVSVYTMGADGRADSSRPHVVAVLDTASISQVAEIPVGRRPFASDCSTDGQVLAVPSHDDGVVDFIDTNTYQVVDTIRVPANPHWVTHDGEGRWWTANHESNVVTRIDEDTYSTHPIVLTADGAPPGLSPHSLAVSPDGTLLAVVAFDSDQLWLIDPRSSEEKVVGVIPTAGHGPQDVAWAPDGKHLYTTDVDSDIVSVIDPATRTVTAYPPTGDGPVSVASSADGRTAYVANLNSNTVTVLDTAQPAEK